MFQLRIFLSWNDVGSSWWGCEPRDYARSGRWPPLTPSLGSQPHHSAPTSIHSGKIPSWNKIFCDLGYPLSKSLAGKFEVFPSWSIFILSCLKEQENIILYVPKRALKDLRKSWISNLNLVYLWFCPCKWYRKSSFKRAIRPFLIDILFMKSYSCLLICLSSLTTQPRCIIQLKKLHVSTSGCQTEIQLL